jgi:hypothetical protein
MRFKHSKAVARAPIKSEYIFASACFNNDKMKLIRSRARVPRKPIYSTRRCSLEVCFITFQPLLIALMALALFDKPHLTLAQRAAHTNLSAAGEFH